MKIRATDWITTLLTLQKYSYLQAIPLTTKDFTCFVGAIEQQIAQNCEMERE